MYGFWGGATAGLLAGGMVVGGLIIWAVRTVLRDMFRGLGMNEPSTAKAEESHDDIDELLDEVGLGQAAMAARETAFACPHCQAPIARVDYTRARRDRARYLCRACQKVSQYDPPAGDLRDAAVAQAIERGHGHADQRSEDRETGIRDAQGGRRRDGDPGQDQERGGAGGHRRPSPEGGPGPRAQVRPTRHRGCGNTGDIFLKHPVLGSIYIELKHVRSGRGDKGKDFSKEIQSAVGAALIATLRHDYALAIVIAEQRCPARRTHTDRDYTAELQQTLEGHRAAVVFRYQSTGRE